MNFILLVDVLLCSMFIRDLFVTSQINEPLPLILLSVYFVLKLLLSVLEQKKFKLITLISVNCLLVMASSFHIEFALFIPFNLLVISFLESATAPFLVLIVIYYLKLESPLDANYIVYTLFALLILIQDNYTKKKMFKLRAVNEKLKNDYDLKLIEIDSSKIMNDKLVYQSQLEERNHLAQKLHDELGHTLAGNIMRLEAIKHTVPNSKTKEMLSEVLFNLREGMDSIRAILKNIKPDSSSINIGSIKTMIAEIDQVDFNLKYSSDINLITIEMWKVINSNIKEAITNMLKYASATKCVITFEKLNSLYKVSIVDNGIGCHNISQGIGLAGMRQRMVEANGQLIVDGSSGFNIVMIFNIGEEKANGN